MRKRSVSTAVIRRLPRYYRYLGTLLDEGRTRISSMELAANLRLTASQIRQDLNCFGGFGQQGYGYNVELLRQEIGKILGVDSLHIAVIIGAGNLAHAFASHICFEDAGFKAIAAFDRAPELIGGELAGYPIYDIGTFESFCREHGVDTAILCVPDLAAPGVAAAISRAGISAVWNFTNYDIACHYPDIETEDVRLSDSLMSLCYMLSTKQKAEKAAKSSEND